MYKRQDLASPSIIGVNAGAGFAVILLLSFFPHAAAGLPPAAFLGAFLTTLLIMAIAGRMDASKATVILAGIAVQALLNAGISFLSLLDTDVLVSYSYFSVGGLSNTCLLYTSYSARMPGSIWTQYGTDGTPICRRNCSSSSRTSAGAKHTAIWQACCTPGRTETIWKKEQKQKTVTFVEPKPVG